jgi:hypothetical protein
MIFQLETFYSRKQIGCNKTSHEHTLEHYCHFLQAYMLAFKTMGIRDWVPMLVLYTRTLERRECANHDVDVKSYEVLGWLQTAKLRRRWRECQEINFIRIRTHYFYLGRSRGTAPGGFALVHPNILTSYCTEVREVRLCSAQRVYRVQVHETLE